MPNKTKKLSVDTCTHAIENYLNSAPKQERLGSLHEVIFYYLHHNLSQISLTKNEAPSARDLKAICNESEQTTHSSFLVALTSLCYKYAPHESIGDILDPSCSHASVIAAFHSQTLKNFDKPIKLTIDLAVLSKCSMNKHATLLFCLKTFAPELIILDNLREPSMAEQYTHELNFIIGALTSKTAFRYEGYSLGQMGSYPMSVFLASVKKATKLSICDTELNRWTADDFKHFLNEIEQNPGLTSLSLVNANLKECCKDERKFKYILQLLGLPQLKKLNLHNNHLSTLPSAQLNLLKKALNSSPIENILLSHVPRELRGTASNTGMFATLSTFVAPGTSVGAENTLAPS